MLLSNDACMPWPWLLQDDSRLTICRFADFVDIEGCLVYTYNPKDGSHTKFKMPGHCSTVCLTEDPDTLVVTVVKYVQPAQATCP